MVRQLFNWRYLLVLVAIAIVSGTVFYSNYLAKKIAADERRKVNVWVQSLKTRGSTAEPATIELTNIITSENKEIPIIATDEHDNPLGPNDYSNLDSNKVKSDSNYLRTKIKEF